MPQNYLTLAERIQLLDMIKTYLPNTSQQKLAELTGVPKTKICLGQEEKLQEWLLRDGLQGASQQQKCDVNDPLVENALNEFFSTVTARNLS